MNSKLKVLFLGAFCTFAFLANLKAGSEQPNGSDPEYATAFQGTKAKQEKVEKNEKEQKIPLRLFSRLSLEKNEDFLEKNRQFAVAKLDVSDYLGSSKSDIEEEIEKLEKMDFSGMTVKEIIEKKDALDIDGIYYLLRDIFPGYYDMAGAEKVFSSMKVKASLGVTGCSNNMLFDCNKYFAQIDEEISLDLMCGVINSEYFGESFISNNLGLLKLNSEPIKIGSFFNNKEQSFSLAPLVDQFERRYCENYETPEKLSVSVACFLVPQTEEDRELLKEYFTLADNPELYNMPKYYGWNKFEYFFDAFDTPIFNTKKRKIVTMLPENKIDFIDLRNYESIQVSDYSFPVTFEEQKTVYWDFYVFPDVKYSYYMNVDQQPKVLLEYKKESELSEMLRKNVLEGYRAGFIKTDD